MAEERPIPGPRESFDAMWLFSLAAMFLIPVVLYWPNGGVLRDRFAASTEVRYFVLTGCGSALGTILVALTALLQPRRKTNRTGVHQLLRIVIAAGLGAACTSFSEGDCSFPTLGVSIF
jgi:hypothetical protein